MINPVKSFLTHGTEVFAEFAEIRPQLRLFRLHKSSNSPEPAHPFR